MRKLLLLLLSLAALSAHGKTLSWNDMTVTAKLDAEGKLTVRETLTFVFDGDWNGGERVFTTRGRQRMSIDRVVRIENGTEIPLTGGSLDVVDNYSMEGNALRWRSRLPSDPPFENKVITYAIDYSLTNILITGDGNRFTLDHDFAFPEREGVIRNYALTLELDPAWQGVVSPFRKTAKLLHPGESMPVTLQLTRAEGLAAPRDVWTGPSAMSRNLLLAGFVAVLALLGFLFYVSEGPSGRFAPLEPAESISKAWLDEHVLSKSPEVIGAAWDDDIGAAEVAAVLARLAAEGKLESRVRGKTLHLKLLVNLSGFQGSDRALIRTLFVGGEPAKGDETNTEIIRKHYKSSGFDPSKIIRDDIQKELDAIPEWKAKKKRVPWAFDLLVLLAAAGWMIYVADSADSTETDLFIRTGFFAFFFGVVAMIAAAVQSHAVWRFPRAFAFVALPLVPAVWSTIGAMRSSEYRLIVLAANAAGVLALVNLVLHVLRIPESPARIAHRRRLVAARRYFAEQLRSENPALDDSWLPYLLAFGLGKNVDRWFKSYATSSGSDFARSSSSSVSGSSSSSGTSWSGGGGAFGGAGATGSWALAAGAMASGVAAPSSSSSGGGSSSSSSSSGGGGGGGW